MRYDFIVIGGGISGITAAIILSKQGYRVALVEKSKRVGPLLRGFHRKGIYFDTGFHYAGGLGDGEVLDVYFRYLGISSRIRKLAYNSDCFDLMRFLKSGFEFRFPFGYERVRERLCESFPTEINAIDSYLQAVRDQCLSPPYLNFQAEWEALSYPSGLRGPSLDSFFSRLTDVSLLKGVAYAYCLLYGVPAHEAPFSFHSRVVGPYFDSVHGIEGGGSALVEALESELYRLGVELLCGQGASGIILSSAGSLDGVRLEDGTMLECAGCICTTHPAEFVRISPESLLRPVYVKRLKNLEDTASGFLLYGECDNHLDINGKTNLFIFHGDDSTNLGLDRFIDKRPFFIATDRKSDSDSSSFVAICPANERETMPWWDTKTGSRPSEYEDFKNKIKEEMTIHIEKTCGGHLGRIVPLECATPLTLRDYANSPSGSLYGAKHKIDQINPLPFTKLQGLYLAGQSVLAPGILGAVVSSAFVCGNIVGHKKLLDELKRCT